jgi:hypothetical protein
MSSYKLVLSFLLVYLVSRFYLEMISGRLRLPLEQEAGPQNSIPR